MGSQLFKLILITFSTYHGVEGFYKAKWSGEMTTTTPNTLEELKNSLCSEMADGICTDKTPRTIIINQVFDFTEFKGMQEELGCNLSSTPQDCEMPLKVLKSTGLCNSTALTKISYSIAGIDGLSVGSNKIIRAEDGGGLNGKGLRLEQCENVEIHGLSITNINPHLLMGGIAIDLIDAKNILIDSNYIKNIGWQMIMTRFGSSTGVTISNNKFDGETQYSATCDGTHHYLWMFIGENERITLERNDVSHISGRSPYVNANSGKTMVHMIHNTFTDVRQDGAIHVADHHSSVLAEGNRFIDVNPVVYNSNGHVYMPLNQTEADNCSKYIQRPCTINTVTNSEGTNEVTSLQVLKDFQVELKEHHNVL